MPAETPAPQRISLMASSTLVAPAVALDDGGLEGPSAQLGHVEPDLPRGCDELALVVAATVGLAAGSAFVSPGAPTISSASCSGRALRVSWTAFLTSSTTSFLRDPSSTDTMGSDMAPCLLR